MAKELPAEVVNESQSPKSSKNESAMEGLYFGEAEQTFQISSYYPDSFLKPYNPDPLVLQDHTYGVYQEMLRDDQVDVAIKLKKDLVVGSGWYIESRDESQADIKEELENLLSDETIRPLSEILEDVAQAYEYGFSISEKIFKKTNKGQLALKDIKPRHPSTWLLHTDDYGNMIRYEQRGAKASIDVEPNSIIHYINNHKFQNPYGTSDLYAAHQAWMTKRHVSRYYAIYLENAAGPKPVAKYDRRAPQGVIDDVFNAIKKFQTKTAMAIPKEFDIEFLEAKTNGEAYTKGINLFNMFIGRALFIPDLLGFQGSETGGGSFSLGSEQIGLFYKHIYRRRQILERIMDQHIIRPLIIYNYGIQENYPCFKFKPLSDVDAMKQAEAWIKGVQGAGWKPSLDEVNHFRTLVKFPLSEDMELKGDAMAEALGGNPNEEETDGPDGDLEESDETESGDKKAAGTKEDDKEETKTGEDVEKKELAMALSTLPGNFKKRVDFKMADSIMKTNQMKILEELEPIVTDAFEDLYAQLERSNVVDNQKIEKTEDIGIRGKYLKQMQAVFKKHFRSLYKDSQIMAKSEIKRADSAKNTNIPADEFLEFLNKETFQYVGDWEYQINKRTRNAINVAIKDGRPLSTVVGIMDDEGKKLSDVSLERYSRTKTTEVFNRGRMEYFNSTGVVAAYQFAAILDDVTCFAADTMVSLSNGQLLPIQDIKVGYHVLSGSGQKRRVVARKTAISKRWQEITLAKKEQICATSTHPFWRIQQGSGSWVESRDLSIKDTIGRIDLSKLPKEIYTQQELSEASLLQPEVLFREKKSREDKSNLSSVQNKIYSLQELAARAPNRSEVLQQKMLDDSKYGRHIDAREDSQVHKVRERVCYKRSGISQKDVDSETLQLEVSKELQKGNSTLPSLRKEMQPTVKEILQHSMLSKMERGISSGIHGESRIKKAKDSICSGSSNREMVGGFCNNEQDRSRNGLPILAQKERSLEERRSDKIGWAEVDKDAHLQNGSRWDSLAIKEACHDIVPCPTDQIEITDIKDYEALEFCYDLEIEGDHSYLVGESRVIAHNSEICGNLHGLVFPADTAPVSPLHFNCRSVLVPITRFEEWSADSVTNSGLDVDKFLEENVTDKGFSVFETKTEAKEVFIEKKQIEITDPGVSFETDINGNVECTKYSKSGELFLTTTVKYADDSRKKIVSVNHVRV